MTALEHEIMVCCFDVLSQHNDFVMFQVGTLLLLNNRPSVQNFKTTTERARECGLLMKGFTITSNHIYTSLHIA